MNFLLDSLYKLKVAANPFKNWSHLSAKSSSSPSTSGGKRGGRKRPESCQ